MFGYQYYPACSTLRNNVPKTQDFDHFSRYYTYEFSCRIDFDITRVVCVMRYTLVSFKLWRVDTLKMEFCRNMWK